MCARTAKLAALIIVSLKLIKQHTHRNSGHMAAQGQPGAAQKIPEKEDKMNEIEKAKIALHHITDMLGAHDYDDAAPVWAYIEDLAEVVNKIAPELLHAAEKVCANMYDRDESHHDDGTETDDYSVLQEAITAARGEA